LQNANYATDLVLSVAESVDERTLHVEQTAAYLRDQALACAAAVENFIDDDSGGRYEQQVTHHD